jgi:hypothetical protein
MVRQRNSRVVRRRGGQVRSFNIGKWLGELVVIVLGVLIALGVDDWRATREERRTEAYYLDALARDLAVDTLEIHRLLADLDSVTIAGHTLALLWKDPRIYPLPDHLANARVEWSRAPGMLYTRLGDFQSSRATYDQMIAAGDLKVVRSSRLREELANYYLGVERHDTQEERDVVPNLLALVQATRARGLITPDLLRDSMALVRMRDDPRYMAEVRGLAHLPGLLAGPRRDLLDHARETLSSIESSR